MALNSWIMLKLMKSGAVGLVCVFKSWESSVGLVKNFLCFVVLCL